jgi:hypothetical protein
MLQDFDFKIMHRLKSKHMNVDALSRNLMGGFEEDEDPKPKVPKKHETILELTKIAFVDGVGGEICVANIFRILEKDDDTITTR